ncbi:MAG: Rrf2 family transcriptional regulator [Planctomycetota bacterium]
MIQEQSFDFNASGARFSLPMLSAKTQYASLAMLELAMLDSEGRPVQAARIAQRHGIPGQFLVQIMHALKRAKLVASTRGAAGGYRLSRSPQEITIGEIVAVFESIEEPTHCAASESPFAPTLLEVCCELSRARRVQLESTTLAELADRAAVHAEPMWYI